MIVGTAGHIDHGKTTLIKSLTSVDTDSLEEEKKRGISINIGFAYLSTPMGNVIGFVDVPGHEKFITNISRSLEELGQNEISSNAPSSKQLLNTQ